MTTHAEFFFWQDDYYANFAAHDLNLILPCDAITGVMQRYVERSMHDDALTELVLGVRSTSVSLNDSYSTHVKSAESAQQKCYSLVQKLDWRSKVSQLETKFFDQFLEQHYHFRLKNLIIEKVKCIAEFSSSQI